ncbi:MAG: protein kinase [Endozoicomonadaceae bacterium]|nr:protein kinase [Endozoicomonadaceae bacterium]
MQPERPSLKPIIPQQPTEIKAWKRYKTKFMGFFVNIYCWAKNKWSKSIPPSMESTGKLPDIVRGIKFVGDGSTGNVYEVQARHSSGVQRTAAYKLERNIIGKRLEKEMRVLQPLSHPNIIKVHNNPDNRKVVITEENELDSDFKPTDSPSKAEYVYAKINYQGKSGLQMDMAQGDLGSLKSKMTQSQTHKAALNLLNAVAYLHDHNVCHMDIKPGNMLWMDNKVVLTDFDGAMTGAAPGEIFIDLNNYENIAITPFYASPESIKFIFSRKDKQAAFSAQAHDVWCSACSIAEILTGEELFPQKYDGKSFDARSSLKSYPLQKRIDEFFEKHHKTLGPKRIAVLKDMLQTDPNRRITASEAFRRFSGINP